MSTVNELNSRFTQPTAGIEIDTEDPLAQKEGIDLTVSADNPAAIGSYLTRYTTEQASSKAVNTNEINEYRLEDAKNRVSSIEDRMEIFLYNLFPYETMSAFGQIESIVDDPGINSALSTSLFTTYTGLQKLKYFTPAELALTLGQNFYTLSFFRGITAKRGKKGNFRFPAGLKDIYRGEVDLDFGRDQNNDTLIESVTQYFTGARDIAESSNALLGAKKEDISPRWQVNPTNIIENKKNSFVDQLDPKNFMEQRRTFLYSVLNDQINVDGKWRASQSEEERQRFLRDQQQLRKHETNEDEYLINRNVLEILQRVNVFDATTWNGLEDPTQASTESFDFTDAKTRNNSTNEDDYLVNPDVLNIRQRVNQDAGANWSGQTDASRLAAEDFDYRDAEVRKNSTDSSDYLINDNVTNIEQRTVVEDNGSWKFETDPSQTNKESFSFRDTLLRNAETSKDEYFINPNVINIKLRSDPRDEGNEGDIDGSPYNLLREKGFLKKGEKWQVGAVYAIPIVAAQYQNSLPPFYIPFEFNPEISENGVEVRYQQTDILSRIGGMQTFTGVGNLSVSLTTKYFAVSHDGKAGRDSYGQEWMSTFTMANVQAIEFAYRSLAYPHYPDEQDADQGYKYVKPPLIKIIIGDYTNQTAPYSNILTYQNDDVINGRLQSNFETGKKILRTFIATSVGIKKDLNETPIYLNEDGVMRDTFGFEVSLNLMEVTPNYVDAPPDFKSYYTNYAQLAETFVNQTETNQQGDTATSASASGIQR